MKKIDKIVNFFSSHNIKDCIIFYGSCLEESADKEIDIDCCILTEQKLPDQLIVSYRKFLIEHNFLIDEEIKYSDKLFISKDQFLEVINLFGSSFADTVSKIDLKNNYQVAVIRVLFNILITRTKTVGDDKVYQELKDLAWKKLLALFQQSNMESKNFVSFTNFLKVGDDYKSYLGFSKCVINYLHNRFSYYTTNDKVVQNLKHNRLNYPNKIAISGLNKQLSYQQFDDLTDVIAEYLLQYDSKYVIVDFPHNEDLVLVVYGIYKARKIYIPLGHDFPDNEKYKISDKFVNPIFITNDTYTNIFTSQKSQTSLICYPQYKKDDVVFIMHTSGTTGTPKGVKVSRSNLDYIMEACQETMPISKDGCYLFSTSNTFDVSLSELFCFLENAASVFVYSLKESRFYKDLPKYTQKFAISHMAFSPSVFKIILQNLSEENSLIMDQYVKFYMIAGEAFKIDLLPLIKNKISSAQVINVYGPTETTVYATYYYVNNYNYDNVPIGYPLQGVNYLIENGELLISGDGVTLGYYGDEELTKSKFIILDKLIYYKTGDLASIEDGKIICHGRKDDQVQINGIRVELNDIKVNLKQIIDPDNLIDLEIIYYDNNLCLFYSGEFIPKLYEILKDKIIYYKLPSKLINIKELPLNDRGKVDKKQLINSYLVNNSVNDFADNGNNSTIDKVRTLVFKRVGRISDQENIFLHGLDSLSSVELLLELEREVKVDFENNNLYDLPTIKAISTYIDQVRVADSTKSEINISSDSVIGKSLYDYPLYYYARIYLHLDFNAIIYDRINLRFHQITYDQIVEKLNKIEIFKTFVDLKQQKFIVKDVAINIDKFELQNINLDLEPHLSQHVYENRQDAGYQYKFLYLYNHNSACLYFAIDHTIFDKSCVDVLKKYILSDQIDVDRNYSTFINAVAVANTEYAVNQFANNYQISQSKIQQLLQQYKEQISFYYVDNPQLQFSAKEIYISCIEYLASNVLSELSGVKINLVYNLRHFKHYDFSATLGDIHTGITYLYLKDQDIKSSIENTIDSYATSLIQPKYFAYKNYPQLSSVEQNIAKIFDEEVFISLNYLGVISERELEKIKNIQTINAEVDKLNSKKLNISIYLVNQKIILLSNKDLGVQIG